MDEPNVMKLTAESGNVGTNKITLSDHQGMVVFHFDRRVDFVALSPEEARQLGEATARQAYRAKFGDFPTTTDTSLFTEQRRIRARNRVLNMIPKEPWKTEAERVKWSAAVTDEIMKLVIA
jgi:uncharacterized protein YbgA (DUF1722 family)